LIGVESKRYEPFRSKSDDGMSEAYRRLVWGAEMVRYERCREGLHDGGRPYARLDAAELVKHAFARRHAHQELLLSCNARAGLLNKT
jgi:hypothetical protein